MGKFKYPTVLTSESSKDDIKRMTPDKFLKKARKLNVGSGDRKVIDSFKKQIKAGDPLSPLKLLKNNREDGRHRATAAKELGVEEVPVIDERVEKAFGGALTSDDPNLFMRNAINYAFAIAPLANKGRPGTGFASGGHVLSDDYPTHYLPNVGRQVMAKGGRTGYQLRGAVEFMPDDEAQAIQTATDVNNGAFGESAEFIPPTPEPTPKVEEPKAYEPFKGFLDYGIRSLVSPDIAPQRIMKSLIEMPETVKEFGKGLAESAYKGATLPGDVITGKVDPESEEGLSRALDLAGLATTGSFGGTRPAGALASGASRPIKETLAEIGHNKPPYERLINPAGFYSHGHEVAMTQLPEGPRTWQEMQALLQKGNVKKEELKWAGLHPEAYDPAQKVTREEIAEKFERNFPQTDVTWKREGAKMAPKWEQYTAPGGADYSESVLHLPYRRSQDVEVPAHIQEKFQPHFDENSAALERNAQRMEELQRLNLEAEKQHLEDIRPIVRDTIRDQMKPRIEERPQLSLYGGNAPTEYRVLSVNGMRDFTTREQAEAFANSQELLENTEKAVNRRVEGLNLFDALEYVPNGVRGFTEKYGHLRNQKAQALKEDQDLYQKRFALQAQAEEEAEKALPSYTKEYFSHESHLGNINNPLLHQRWKERVGPEGERILSNEELQSDWAQQGREQGFKNPEAEKLHEELTRKNSSIVQEQNKEFLENRQDFDRKVSSYIEKYNKDEAELTKEYAPKMAPEEINEYERLIKTLEQSGGDALSKQEKMRYRYLSNKDHAALALDKNIINQDYLIRHEYNAKIQPFVDESIAKTRAIEVDASLTPAEKQKLIDQEEARYTEKVKPYDEWQEKALKENQRRVKEYGEKLLELKIKHDEDIAPYYDEFEARADAIDSKYAKLLHAIKEEKAKLPKSGEIPLVPHVGSTEQWTELGVKHALQHALESGHDQIFIMGGQEQARRYQNALRSAVDNIRWEEPGTVQYPTLSSVMGEPAITDKSFRTVYAKPKGGGQEHKFVIDKDGRVTDSNLSQAKGEKISAVVGSDLAKQIMKEKSGNVPMENYIMNSEGYTQHYERKVPSAYKDIIKKYLKVEPKVEAGKLREQGGPSRFPTDDEIDVLLENMSRRERNELSRQNFGRSYDDLSPNEHDELYELAHEAMVKKWHKQNKSAPSGIVEGPHGTTIHITPAMKEAYKRIKQEKGAVFPGYKKGGAIKNAINVANNLKGKYNV